MRSYLDLLRLVYEQGRQRDDRTGVGTRGVFGAQLRHDLSTGFPLLTTKKVHLRSIVQELLWFIHGRTDNAWLQERGVSIWDEWATPEQCAAKGNEPGDLGPVYGYQWRSFGGHYPQRDGVDQLAWVIDEIRRNPTSRRLVVSAWNPNQIERMALPPCHALFQFYVHDGRLSCQLYQRSADIFLGVPFNIASYALLTHLVAHVTGLAVGDFVHSFGDLHLYNNHVEQAQRQLAREPRPLPTLRVNPARTRLEDIVFEDIEVIGYDPHPGIKAPVAV